MKYDKNVINRIKRMEGQLRGIITMLDEDKDCKDVITQLSAVRSALDKSIGLIVSENLVKCVSESNNANKKELIEEAVNLLVKSR